MKYFVYRTRDKTLSWIFFMSHTEVLLFSFNGVALLYFFIFIERIKKSLLYPSRYATTMTLELALKDQQ